MGVDILDSILPVVVSLRVMKAVDPMNSRDYVSGNSKHMNTVMKPWAFQNQYLSAHGLQKTRTSLSLFTYFLEEIATPV